MTLDKGVFMMDFHVMLTPDGGGSWDAAAVLHYASLAGLRFVGLALPSDGSNFSGLTALASQVRRLSLYANVEACVGVELRHIPPALLPFMVREAREAGAEFVLVHGETIGDQVEPGTNFAAIEAGADILAHPGLIDEKAAAFAAERGVALEFTSCPKHALANAHVASMALRFGCLLVKGSGARCAAEMPARNFWPQIVRGTDVFGKTNEKSNLMELLKNSENFLFDALMNPQKRKEK